MAAPKYTDRVLAQEVRSLTLKKIKEVLEGEHSEFQKAVLLKLAGTVLPRLSEVTGEDGRAITIHVAREIAETEELYDPSPNPSGDSEGQA